MALFALALIVGATLAFSATEFKGARQTRAFIASVHRVVKKQAARWLPSLREGAEQAVSSAKEILAAVSEKAGPPPECPPGTRHVNSLLGRDPSTRGKPGEPAQTELVCVDQHLVSELDYDTCATCEPARLRPPARKSKLPARSEFCLTGKNPTTAPIRCVTWKQADAYCQDHAGRLPDEDELRAVTPSGEQTALSAPSEWTQAAPSAGRERVGAFRCVHSH